MLTEADVRRIAARDGLPVDRTLAAWRIGLATPLTAAGQGAGAPAARSAVKQAVKREHGPVPTPPNGVVALSLPWDALCSDRERVAPLGAAGKASRARYREAMARAVRAIRDQIGEADRRDRGLPWAVDVALVADVWLPDGRRRDVANCAKACHDALQAAGVLADDWHLADVRWRRAGLDPEHPRAELRLVPIGWTAA